MLKGKIELLYKDFKELEEVVNERNKNLAKKDLKEEKNIDIIQEVMINKYVDSILYNKDLQLIFARLITLLDFYKETETEPLREDIDKFYKDMRQWMPRRTFAVEKGELVEVEDGILERERKAFLEGDYFKAIKEKLSNSSSK